VFTTFISRPSLLIISSIYISVVNARRAFACEMSRWISPEYDPHRVLPRRISAYALPYRLGYSSRYSCFKIWYCFLDLLKWLIISSAYLTIGWNARDSHMFWISSYRLWGSQGIIKVCRKKGKTCKRRAILNIVSQMSVKMELIRYSCPFMINWVSYSILSV
jgi:hypothetical protein